jgi:hypothetical protein
LRGCGRGARIRAPQRHAQVLARAASDRQGENHRPDPHREQVLARGVERPSI